MEENKKEVKDIPETQTKRPGFNFPEKEICLTEKEINDLMAKGQCNQNELTITAMHESTFNKGIMKRLKEEHVLLFDYKKKVDIFIDNLAGNLLNNNIG